jgi:glutamine---fructose-6-phosphate transaminase (isomerizing)
MSEPTTYMAQTFMAREIAETPDVVGRMLGREDGAIGELAARLAGRMPAVVVTCARGSSDNAAAYFKYLVEILIGVPVASIGPSVASLYRAPLRLEGAVVVSVSQSGQSPDIVALQAAARKAGAFAIAVVNDAASPLAGEADATLAVHAGVEKSVAATKTFLASAAMLAALAARWAGDAGLQRAVAALPDSLGKALDADWGALTPVLTAAESAYVLGRGPALPIAAEAALKLKETAVLHAEAFSGAEVMHGPLQLVDRGFPVLALRPKDAADAAMGETVARIRAAGGAVFEAEAGAAAAAGRLPVAATGHPFLDPLAMLAAFYRVAESVARGRGHDPDKPTQLRKVTETL